MKEFVSETPSCTVSYLHMVTPVMAGRGNTFNTVLSSHMMYPYYMYITHWILTLYL